MRRNGVEMAREPRAALRYSDLGSSSVRCAQWRACDDEREARDSDFESSIARLCEAARHHQSAEAPRGTRSAAQLTTRIEKRHAKALRQSAIDLLRLDDLEDRMAQRSALALRQRWFVLGRVLDTAMKADAALAQAMLAILERAELRRDERQLLGLTARRSKPE